MGKISSTELSLVERVGAEADVAGSAQLLVRNETPNKFIARDETGDEQRLGISLGIEVDVSTGATSFDITGIPSGVRQITAMLIGVSTSSTSDYIIQLGTSGGIVTTGYQGRCVSPGASFSAYSNGFVILLTVGAAGLHTGRLSLSLQNKTDVSWVGSSLLSGTNTNVLDVGAGDVSLASELAQLRLTTVGGTNTFDAGVWSIQFS